MNPDIRDIQIALAALNFPPGPLDGLWGPRTEAGIVALLAAKEGRWGQPVERIHDALIDLGYMPGAPLIRVWSPELTMAMGALVSGKGRPRGTVTGEDKLVDATPTMTRDHGRVMYQGLSRYPINLFVMHTSATSSTWWRGKSNQEMFDEIRRWHVVGNGWSDIGYHGVAFPDGEVIEGRAWSRIGAHVKEANRGSIGYCMVPVKTIDRMATPADFYTSETLASMRAVIDRACNATRIERIAGHNEFANKLCPGFKVGEYDWFAG